MQTQQGQALVEMVMVSALLLLAASSLLWLQRWQEVKAQTQHHAGFAAFRYTQTHLLGPEASAYHPAYMAGLFSPVSHSIQLQHSSTQPLKNWAPEVVANQDALLGVTERVQFRALAQHGKQYQPEIAWWMPHTVVQPALQLTSHTLLDVGLGAPHSSAHMIERLQGSTVLWANAYRASKGAFSQWGPRLRPVDQAWQRAEPNTQWLAPWRDAIPSLLP